MLADADGNIASLQLSNTRYDVRYPDHSGILYHTNHYQTPKMQEVEISPDAIYSDTAPEQMRGRNVLESALRREQRYEELLNKEGEFSFSELHHIGCDHGEEEDEGKNLPLTWSCSPCPDNGLVLSSPPSEDKDDEDTEEGKIHFIFACSTASCQLSSAHNCNIGFRQ